MTTLDQMPRPVHFDLAEVEKTIRAHVAQSMATLREKRRSEGKDEGLVPLHESMMEMHVVANLQIMKALNEGYLVTEIAEVLGGVIGNVIGLFAFNFDREGKIAPVMLDRIDTAIVAILSNKAPTGAHISEKTRIVGAQGGSA